MIKRFFRLLQVSLLAFLVGSTLVHVGARNVTFSRLATYFLLPPESYENTSLAQIETLSGFMLPEDRRRYERYRTQLEGLLARANEPELRRYRLSRVALEKAQRAEVQGLPKEAITHYHEAVAQGSEQVQLEALLGLGRVLQAQGNTKAAESALAATAAFVPREALIRKDACLGWRLAGAYIDDQDIQLDRPVHIILVWERRQEIEEPAKLSLNLQGNWTFQMVGDRVFQMGQERNFVRDGGFNQVASLGAHIPIGFRPLFARQTVANSMFMTGESDSERGVYLRLDGRGEQAVGLGLEYVSVEKDHAYLMGAKYRSAPQSQPRIGVRWILADAQTSADNQSDYATRSPSSEWVRMVYFTQPLTNAVDVSYWALDASPDGHLDLDDLFLFSLPLPCSPASS